MTTKKFLLVDDDERFAELVAKKLEKYAQCTIATEGDDALLQFEHHMREQAPFHAIFMDIEMPKMNGHQVVEKMRHIETQNKTDPVKAFKLVMITAHKDVKNVSTSFFKGGADAYIYKGNLNEKLIEELENAKII